MTRRDGTLLLRQERDRIGQLGEGRLAVRHDAQHLERRHDAVAARGVLADDHVAALLAAQSRARHEHAVEDVLVADGSPNDLAAGGLDRALQPAVREHGHDEPALRQHATLQPVQGEDAQHLVAIHDAAVGIDRDQAVRVAIEGETHIGAPGRNGRGERAWGRRPAVDVDVHAVRLVVDHVDLGTGRGQDLRRDDAARTIGAIQHDPDRGADRAGKRKAVLAVAVQQFAGRANAPQPRVHRAPSARCRRPDCAMPRP